MKVLFYDFDNISGRLSKWSTKSDWSHVDLLFPGNIVIGATRHGVERMPLRERLSGPRPIRAVRLDTLTVPDPAAALAFAESQVGKGYDWTAMMGMFVPWRVNWNDPHRWYCAELVAACAAAGGRPVARLEEWRITPAFLAHSPLLRTDAGPIYPHELDPEWDDDFMKDAPPITYD